MAASWHRLRGVMIVAEGTGRTERLRLRDAGQLTDEAMRELQRQLDLEEVALEST